MRGNLIALDLETTGLDVENDSIIEVGAVRMNNGDILAEYSQLINPGFVIPAETTHITGIHQDDVRNAPPLSQVLPEIKKFVGDVPVIAHNVSFDVSFMRRFGALHTNLPLDTFEMATVLLPRVPRYSLSSLAEHYQIDLENAHRALDDARATALLYWHLWQKALSLPEFLLREISQSSQALNWETGQVFEAAFNEVRGKNPGAADSVLNIFKPPSSGLKPFIPDQDAVRPVDADKIAALVDAGGAMSQALEFFEQRPQQVDMARSITSAFNTRSHLMIEAGTGTGKSIAYLVPAMMWATKNKQRVVISTNTLNLQDQLIKKDVPLVQNALGVDCKTSVMKGRGNYLCPRRLAAMRRRQPNNIDELRTMAKILVWLQESQSGDKNELSLRSGEYYVWSRLSAEDESCGIERCAGEMNGICPFYKARKEAEASQVLIVNHALLIRDAINQNQVLPRYDYLVVDEAHQLEDAVTGGLSERLRERDLVSRLKEVGGLQSGLLGTVMGIARANLPDKEVMRLEAFIPSVGDAARAAQIYGRKLFQLLYQFISDSGNENSYKFRIDERARNHQAFSQVENHWKTLAEFIESIVEALRHLGGALRRLQEEYDVDKVKKASAIAFNAGSSLGSTMLFLDKFISMPETGTIYWINNGSTPQWISLETAPLHIGSMMEEFIWNQKESAVLTSATLQTASSFDYIRERLYADRATELAVGSPFNYKASTLVYVPEDMPMPNERGYQKAVEKGIVDLAGALDGRVLALFTSYSQLRETAANISPRLSLGNITVYDQATGGSRESLLDSFKSTEKAVLLGTRSFWEGVDIPGDDLSALVIVRLPFSVPSDPVFAARSATYSNSFREYAVPDAILRFRQGFGRLIRRQTDRGIVALFDTRVVKKSYGYLFLDSLPDCHVAEGRLDDLPGAARRWLDADTTI